MLCKYVKLSSKVSLKYSSTYSLLQTSAEIKYTTHDGVELKAVCKNKWNCC